MADRRYDMALQYAADKDFAAAADLLSQAIEIAPDWPPLHFHYGEILRLDEKYDQARVSFHTYLSLDPEDRMGAVIKMALMDAVTPPSLPAAYVQSLFDQYAPRFEKALVEKLQYNTPELLHRLVMAQNREIASILDLGCGTGLAAALFAKNPNPDIDGVDLSPAMIEIAQQKNIYRHLYVADITSHLETNITHYDLILSADVFVYMGDLEKIFRLISRCMSPEGLLAFSVQTLDKGSYLLGNDHRYAHSRSYIEYCAENARLAHLSSEETVLRMDGGNPIRGMVFLYRKMV